MDDRRTLANRVILAALVDVGLTMLALHLASWSRYLIPWGVELPWRIVALPWPVYLMSAVIWPVVLSLTSVYRSRTHTSRRVQAEIQSLLLGVGLALLVLAGGLYFTFRSVPRRLFFYFGLIDVSFLILARLLSCLLRRTRHRNGHVSKLLIVGAGKVGQAIARQVQQYDDDWHLIGFLDDDAGKIGTRVAGARVLDALDALEPVVRSNQIDEIIFALPLRAHQRLVQLILEMERLPVEVSVVPDYFDLAFFRTRMEELFGFPLIRLRASAIEGGDRIAKRVFDLLLTIPLLILCLPILPVIALAIRLDSPGPVFFRQERVGENCRVFGMWKFRTMVQGADELLREVIEETSGGEIVHKRPDDPRVTRIGRFLRRYSIDELPQLWNVIKGEMSLVGPRPELPWLVDRYEGWQRKRFAVPPGITGWWQISGRSERLMHLHVEDDLYYIQNHSIWLDLRILWRTIGVVLSGEGAY